MPGKSLLADRLRDELLEEMTSSQLPPGTKLPTEGELVKRFGVSRATVREAVTSLVEAGYVTRRHGSGSYVAERRRMPHGLDSTLSYLAMIESAGALPGCGCSTQFSISTRRSTAPCTSARATWSWQWSACGRPTTSR